MSSQNFLQKIERQSILTRNRMIVEAIKRGKAISTSGTLIQSLIGGLAIKMKNGVPFKIRYGIRRHGVFIYKGVGKGTSIAQAKSGNSKRKKIDWYKTTIEKDTPTFGDLWREYYAEKIMEDLKIDLDNLEK